MINQKKIYRFHSILILAFLTFILPRAWAADFFEHSHGPLGGGIDQIVAPSPDTLFLSTGANIYMTKNAGQDWKNITSFYSMKGINSFTVLKDYSLYACTGAGLYRSTNMGQSWKQLMKFPCWSIMMKDSNIYTGTDVGVYYYSITTKKWSHLTNGMVSKRVNDFHQSFGKIFAATNKGLYYSKNDGGIWSINWNLPQEPIYEIEQVGDTIFIANQRGIYFSVDFGNNWNNLSYDTGEKDFRALYVDESIIVAGNDNGILFSNNRGKSWQESSLTTASVFDITARDGRIYIASNDGLFSTDYTFHEYDYLEEGLEYLGVFSIFRGLDGYFWAGTEHGLYRSVDGDYWNLIPGGLSDYKINAVMQKDNYLFAGTEENGLMMSMDGGQNWDRQTTILASKINDIAIDSLGRIFVATKDWGVYYLNKQNWVQLTNGIDIHAVVQSVACSADGRIYAGTLGAGLYYRDYLSSSWVRLTSDKLQASDDIHQVSCIGDMLYVGSSRGFFISSDKGETWVKTTSGLPGVVTEFCVTDSMDIYGGLNYMGIYKLHHDSTRWERLVTSAAKYYVGDLLLLPNGYILLGTTDNGVYRSGQSVYNNILSIVVTPPGTTVISPKDTLNYTLMVIDGLQNPVQGAEVTVSIMGGSQQILLTGSDGRVEYKEYLHDEYSEKEYDISFEATFPGYFSEGPVDRKFIVTQLPSLSLMVSPAQLPETEWGDTLRFELYCHDIEGNDIQSSQIIVSSNLFSSDRTIFTNAEGRTEFVYVVQRELENGDYYISFRASKKEYSPAPTYRIDFRVRHYLLLNIRLTPTDTLKLKPGDINQYVFRIDDTDTGQPVEGAEIEITQNLLEPRENLTTAYNGYAFFNMIVPDETETGLYTFLFTVMENHHDGVYSFYRYIYVKRPISVDEEEQNGPKILQKNRQIILCGFKAAAPVLQVFAYDGSLLMLQNPTLLAPGQYSLHLSGLPAGVYHLLCSSGSANISKTILVY